MEQVIKSTQNVRPPTQKITYDEFLQKYMDVHAEWIDGEVIVFMSASARHQLLVGWLVTILKLFIEAHDLGELFPAPFNMHLAQLKRGREPDLLFIAADRLDIIQTAHISEAADLAIEIISPESVGRDRGEKFVEYEAAGVREYWLIDPDRQQAEFYKLADNGRYRLSSPDETGHFHSTVLPGFWLEVDVLWQDPLPKMLDVIRQLGLLE